MHIHEALEEQTSDKKNSNYLTARKPHEICSGTSIDVHQLNLIMGNNHKNKTTTAAAAATARAKNANITTTFIVLMRILHAIQWLLILYR